MSPLLRDMARSKHVFQLSVRVQRRMPDVMRLDTVLMTMQPVALQHVNPHLSAA